MAILKDTHEYAKQLMDCYSKENWPNAAFEAAQAHRELPASYFREIHNIIMEQYRIVEPHENIGSI